MVWALLEAIAGEALPRVSDMRSQLATEARLISFCSQGFGDHDILKTKHIHMDRNVSTNIGAKQKVATD